MSERDIEAFVYRKMVEHFQANNETVQNIDVMNVAGFCRNCLTKWYFVGAHKLGSPCTYDEACEKVYGIPYGDWKKLYQKKATAEQMELFNSNTGIHAQHPELEEAKNAEKNVNKKPVVASDVCCQDPSVGDQCALDMVNRLVASSNNSHHHHHHHHIEEAGEIRLGIVTISDRASARVYEDKSGPEIKECVDAYAAKSKSFTVTESKYVLVPDDADYIRAALIELSTTCNLILTTGGTGLTERDVTPEATLKVLEKEVRGIPEAIRRETSKIEPMAMLSRAVAGVRNKCLIINLPGRPKAVREAMAVVLPVLNHAVQQANK